MSDCVFCRILADELPSSRVYEDDSVIALMDIFPLRRGHVLVIPRQHHQQVHELPAASRERLLAVGAKVAKALYSSSLQPAAVHYVINDGPQAQQSVPHVHLHVLPRYHGDSARFLLRLLRKPLDLVLGPTPAAALAGDAELIREQLQTLA